MEAGLYSLEEASRLTGLSIEALRKRVTRRKLGAVKSNDGRVRVRLDDQTIFAIKRDGQAGQKPGRLPRRPDGHNPDKTLTDNALSRVIEVVEQLAVVRVDQDRERADKAEVRADRESARADRAEAERVQATIR